LGIEFSIAIAIPLILSPPVQLQFRSLSSHGSCTFTDIIVTLRLHSSAVRSKSDTTLAFGFVLFSLELFVRMRTPFDQQTAITLSLPLSSIEKLWDTHIITRISLDYGLRTHLLSCYAHRISTPSDVAISTRACAVGLRF
jgi:hypothetical protein